MNKFGYANQNPLRYTDPTGEFAALLLPVLPSFAGWTAGVVGTTIGGWLGWNVFGPMLSENAEDPAVYPDNPDVAPEKFENIPRSPGKYCPSDGSVWERDTSGHGNREGEGSQWKRWPDKKTWSKGKTPNSIWPDGRIRK